MEQNIILEAKTGKGPSMVSMEKTEQILDQMKYYICQIQQENSEKRGTGFFCYIPHKEKQLPALITAYHVLDEEVLGKNKEIILNFNNCKESKTILVNDGRKIYYFADLDITIIQIRTIDDITKFMEISNEISDKDKNYFTNLSSYILHYPEGKNNAHVSYGLLAKIADKSFIYHHCETEHGSSGSPILSLNTMKIIGVHKGTINLDQTRNINAGIFFHKIIERMEDENPIKSSMVNIKIEKNEQKKFVDLDPHYEGRKTYLTFKFGDKNFYARIRSSCKRSKLYSIAQNFVKNEIPNDYSRMDLIIHKKLENNDTIEEMSKDEDIEIQYINYDSPYYNTLIETDENKKMISIIFEGLKVLIDFPKDIKISQMIKAVGEIAKIQIEKYKFYYNNTVFDFKDDRNLNDINLRYPGVYTIKISKIN